MHISCISYDAAQVSRLFLDLPSKSPNIITNQMNRDEVYAEVLETHRSAGVRWRRFPILTELLKGHRRGELTIFTGPTGAGKTTFISEYSLDLCAQNVTTLWGSFEIRNVRLIKTMLQQFSGAPLPQNTSEFASIADEFEQLPMYYLTFHGHQSVKAVLDVSITSQFFIEVTVNIILFISSFFLYLFTIVPPGSFVTVTSFKIISRWS